MPSLRVHSDIDDIPADQWDRLVGEGSPFLEHAWLSLLERSGSASPETGWHPQHLSLWEEDQLVAACPVYIKTHSMGEFVYDWSWANAARQLGERYYPKVVVGVPFTPVTGQRLLVAREELRPVLVRALLELARVTESAGLHILFNPESEARSLEAEGGASRLQFQFHWRNHDYSDFEDFLSGFRSKRRSEFRRERRRLRETGVELVRVSGAEIQPEQLRAMEDFYRNTCWQFGGNSYLRPELWDALLERFGHRLQLVLAYDHGEPIAGALNVQKGSRLYGRYWGCSQERPYLHFEVCYYQAIEHCIASGLEVFEPGHGGGHKYPRGFQPTLTWSSHWLRSPRLEGPVRDFLERERAAVREQAEQLREQAELGRGKARS